LRASAVTACATIVKRAHELSGDEGRGWLAGWTEQQLDGWLWDQGKREELRKVNRVAERGTVFY